MTTTMETVNLTLNGADLLTHSARTAFAECCRKYELAYVRGIRPAREPDYFRFGGAYHVGLETLAKSGALSDAVAAVRKNYAKMPEWVQKDEDVTAWRVEEETVVRMVCGWHWRWQNDEMEVVQAEQVFDLPIINPETGKPARNHRQGGKRDQLIKRLSDGRLLLREFKTTSDDITPTSTYWKHLAMDGQVSAYFESYAAEGVELSEVMYDVCRKPGIRPRKLSRPEATKFAMDGHWYGERFEPEIVERETPAMYGARLSSEIAESPDRYFARKIITRTQADLLDWRWDLWQTHQQISECRRHDRWPRTGVFTKQCTGPYSPCAYLKLCSDGWEPSQGMPEGFKTIENVHPELAEEQ